MDCAPILCVELNKEELDWSHEVTILDQVLGLLRGEVLDRVLALVPLHLLDHLASQVSRLLGHLTECSHSKELRPP